MQAYKHTTLYNKNVQEQAAEAFLNDCLPEESYKKILQAHPVDLYTPNYFIRIALGALTFIILLFLTGLVWLMTGISSNEDSISGVLIFMAILCYVTLEIFVNQRSYYNAGIDNILMAGVLTCLYSAILAQDTFSHLAISQIALVICAWLCIRFVDAFMGMLAYAALYAFIFLICVELGTAVRAAAPLIMLAFSAGMFVIISGLLEKQKAGIYTFCYKAIQILSLVGGYVSVNYLIVSEINSDLFGAAVRFGWLFWPLTITFPIVYMAYGIRRRKLPFIITGLVLAAFTCYTIRCFYHAMPYEIALVLAGTVLLLIGYILVKYLKIPRWGFSAAPDNRTNRKNLEAEAALLVQLFGKPHGAPADTNTTRFGGGSSGGGGAAGNY